MSAVKTAVKVGKKIPWLKLIDIANQVASLWSSRSSSNGNKTSTDRSKTMSDQDSNGPFKNILAGGQRKKGESGDAYNQRAHRAYKDDWVIDKKRSGTWLSPEEYENKTGKPGRK